MIFITFTGIMQIILNVILREHGTPVPGTAAVPLPVDISRSLTCNTTNNFSNPEIIPVNWTTIGIPETFNITNCHDNFLNFISDFERLVNIVEDLNTTDERVIEYQAMLQNFTLKTFARPQDLLFNLPMFYIGK